MDTNARRDAAVHHIATYLIDHGHGSFDTHDVASSFADDDEFTADFVDDIPVGEFTDVFNGDTNTVDWLDAYTTPGNHATPTLPELLTQTRRSIIVTTLRRELDDRKDTITTAVAIHDALDSLADTTYAVNHAPNASEVVHAFFTWVGEQSAAGNTEYEDLTNEDVHEGIVTGRVPLDPDDTRTINALHDWVTTEHPEHFSPPQ